MKVFAEEIIRDNPKFFLAGRGGETNLHKGNHHVRQRILDNAKAYAILPAGERGQKFSQKVLREKLQDVEFVVKLSYFWKNYENGKIASTKLESVVKEHGSLSTLEGLSPTSYVTIGETWCLNMIGAILRQAAGKLDPNDPNDPNSLKPKPPRKGWFKHKAAPKSNLQQKQGDKTQTKPEMHTPEAKMPVQDSEPDSIESSVPCDMPLLHVAKRPRLNRFSLETIKLPECTKPAANILHKARRVSLGNSLTEPVCFQEESFFPPICDQDRPERASALPRLVSSGSIPQHIPDEILSSGEPQDYFDPLEHILDDWDIEKWPQLDLYDLLAV